MPKVSFICGNFNKQSWISEAIFSITHQSEKDIELIIVDDASQDNSMEVINYYKEKDKRITVVKNDVNKGVAFTYNRATELTTAPIILVAASDDVYSEYRAKWTLDYFKKNKDKDAVYFPFYKADFLLKPFEKKKAIPFDYEKLKLANGQFIGHGFMAYKREVGLKVPYRADLKYGCDHAFCLDVYKAGFKYGNVSDMTKLAGTYRFTPSMVSIQHRDRIVEQDNKLETEYLEVK